MLKRYFSVLIITSCISSCSVVTSRNNNGVGHVYIATEESINSFMAINALSMMYLVVPLVITLPLTTADLAVSIVTDTIMLPVDLIVDSESKEREIDAGLRM